MTNKELKYFANLKKKEFRDSENLFLIEGNHLIDECLSSKYYSDNIIRIFLKNDYKYKLPVKLINSGLKLESLSAEKFNKISETKNPQGTIAVIKKNKSNFSNIEEIKLAVALDSINDPGNLGTILRTCWWFGVDTIFINSNSVDLFNAKVIRGSQGALFNSKIVVNADINNLINEFHKSGFEIYATDLKSEKYIDKFSFIKKEQILVIFGNEANGINPEILLNPNVKRIKIHGFSKCESLNVGVSVGIILSRIKNQN